MFKSCYLRLAHLLWSVFILGLWSFFGFIRWGFLGFFDFSFFPSITSYDYFLWLLHSFVSLEVSIFVPLIVFLRNSFMLGFIFLGLNLCLPAFILQLLSCILLDLPPRSSLALFMVHAVFVLVCTAVTILLSPRLRSVLVLWLDWSNTIWRIGFFVIWLFP